MRPMRLAPHRWLNMSAPWIPAATPATPIVFNDGELVVPFVGPSRQSNGEFRLSPWSPAPLDMRHCSSLPPAAFGCLPRREETPKRCLPRGSQLANIVRYVSDQYDARVDCPSA